MGCEFGPRRAVCVDVAEITKPGGSPLSVIELAQFESLDTVYRALCAAGASSPPPQNSIRRRGPSLKLMLDAEERALPTGGLPTAK